MDTQDLHLAHEVTPGRHECQYGAYCSSVLQVVKQTEKVACIICVNNDQDALATLPKWD